MTQGLLARLHRNCRDRGQACKVEGHVWRRKAVGAYWHLSPPPHLRAPASTNFCLEVAGPFQPLSTKLLNDSDATVPKWSTGFLPSPHCQVDAWIAIPDPRRDLLLSKKGHSAASKRMREKNGCWDGREDLKG